MSRPAAFLERDGVINIDYGHVGDASKLEYVPGALASIAYLNKLGFLVFVVTNQAGIAKGKYSLNDYENVMAKILSDLKLYSGHIDDIRFCPYHENAVEEKYRFKNHPWRKPNAGMIMDLVECGNVDMTKSFLVGDKKTDILAAQAARIAGFLYDGELDLKSFIMTIPQVSAADQLNL